MWQGGGGRPGDTDAGAVGGTLVTPTFLALAALSGRVPLVGVAGGNCFAGAPPPTQCACLRKGKLPTRHRVACTPGDVARFGKGRH